MARVTILMGNPVINEDAGQALEAILPGYLVEAPVAGVSVQSVSDLAVPPMVAIERDELGRGVDDSLGVGEAGAAAYAVGETVKVATFAPGMRAQMFIASGVSVLKDDQLDSAGDGTLQGLVGTVPLCRSLEAIAGGLGLVDVAVRIEFI